METDISPSPYRPYLVSSVVGIVSLGVGLGLGYILGKRNGDIFIVDESALTDEDFVTVEDEGRDEEWDRTHPAPGFEKAVTIIKEEGYGDVEVITNAKIHSVSLVAEGGTGEIISVDEIVATTVEEARDAGEKHRRHIFDSTDEWDLEREMETRDPEKPYIIGVDEYIADDMGFVQVTYTYYEGDHILLDQADQPIAQFERITGELRFGHGSNAPDVVYIRNEEKHMEMEICREKGHYLIEVMGGTLEAEYEEQDLKHSRDRKFRVWD